jgi:hypothetical protein
VKAGVAAGHQPLARLQLHRSASDSHRGIGLQPARIRYAEAQLGLIEHEAAPFDSEPVEVCRQLEAGVARKGGLVDDRIVDRIAASLRIQLDVGTMDEGREVKFAAPLDGARAVDRGGLGDELRIGHDEHRPRDDLRSSPPGGDRRLGSMRLGLAVVDQRVDHEQRYPEDERHETDEKQPDTGTSLRHDTAPSAMSRARRAMNR